MSTGKMETPKAKTTGMRIDFYFVPFPQEIWSKDIDLTQAQFKLLGYLLMHQVRFARSTVMLSDDELLNGRRASNGTRMDHGCGIRGRNNLRDARAGLERLGWIRTNPSRFGRLYEVVLSEWRGSETDPPTSESDHEGSESDPSESDRQVSESDTQTSESDPPNKEIKKSFKKSGKKKPSATAVAAIENELTDVTAIAEEIAAERREFNEFELAQGVILQVGIPGNKFLMDSIARAIVCIANRTGNPKQSAAQWLIGQLNEYQQIEDKRWGLSSFIAEAHYDDDPNTWSRGNANNDKSPAQKRADRISDTSARVGAVLQQRIEEIATTDPARVNRGGAVDLGGGAYLLPDRR